VTNLCLSKINTLNIKSNLLALNEDSIIVGNSKFLDIYSYEGELKNKINIDPNGIFGDMQSFNPINKFLLVCTANNYFGIFDISRRTIKQITMFRRFENNGESLGEIRDASINSKGNFVLFVSDTMANSDVRIPNTKFHLFDVEMDSFSDFEISPNRIPIEIIWDINDYRLFGIYTEYAKEEVKDSDKDEHFGQTLNTPSNLNPTQAYSSQENETTWVGSEFTLFFYTSEYGILKQESHKINKDIQGVFALSIPSLWFIVSKTNSNNRDSSLIEKKFQFFEGLEKIDENVKLSLIEFSIFMSCGKLDEAYKIVKNIKSTLVWENMAAICIKTKRLDVLEICLSNMRFTRGIKALRESKHEKDVEVRLALVAMHLGMIEEAKTLLQSVGRWEVLSRFYISIGDYEKAIQITKTYDRIDLQNTYYRIAEHYERIKIFEKAIEYYKLSGCLREIPRMLVNNNRLDLLEAYMGKGEDLLSLLWWASYSESQGDFEKALLYYRRAKDWSNVVRILIQMNRITEAKEICDNLKDPGACFLMGRYYESISDIRNAIYYYALSGRINQAFRLAKEHNMDIEIFNLGLKATNTTQNLIADYFADKGVYDKAITLYLLAGNIKKALKLCLLTNQYDKIREIADNIEYKNDKDTLRALAEYFLEQKQYEKALSLFIKLKDYDICMKICENHKIKISPQTANTIIDDIESQTDKDNETKLNLITRMAKLLMMQGDFEAAHQIFVKLGNLKKAMKCLIKMGNKPKVIEFAHTCRLAELYILAANFLQSLDWVDDEDLVKTIVTFYTKAKAHGSLANFYELFANVEVNEFRNYEKAVILYQEAINALEKWKEEEDKKSSRINLLNNKIKITKVFLNAMKSSKENPDETLRMCNELLNVVRILFIQ
jgi:intraflagellar transport protein 140